MTTSARRTPAAVASLAAAVTALTGCGSSSGTNATGAAASPASSAAASGSASAAVTAAKTEYAAYLKAQAPLVIPALPAKPPSGKTITIVSCPAPVCAQETDPAAQAAKLLGWKVTASAPQQSPENYQAALNQIVASPTDFVALTPVTPDSFISKQLAALQQAGSKVIEMSPSGSQPSANGPVQADVAGIPVFSTSGRLMGDAVVNDANGAASTLFVWDPSIATVLGSVKDSYTKVVTSAGGSVAVLDVSFANIGKTIPGQVASYIQAHPKIKYVAYAVSDAATGVPQALASAGLSGKVKMVSRAPSAATLADIKSGAQLASVGEENAAGGYRAVDLFARLAMGVDLGELRNTEGWHQIFDHSNVTSTSSAPVTPGYPDAFLTAWHLK